MALRPEGTPEEAMPSTHLSLHYHIVFSTKDRQPFIADSWRSRLHEYLGGLIRAAEGIPEIVGGTEDHVHLLAGLRATHVLTSFVQDVKQSSSRWIHETIGVKEFAWQSGYGAFTVSASNRDTGKAIHRKSGSTSPEEIVPGGIRRVPAPEHG